MKALCGFAVGVLFSAAAAAQPADTTQVDLKARLAGPTAWLDAVDVTVGTANVVHVDVAVFLKHSSGWAMSTCLCSLVTSPWMPGDVATLLDRDDSFKHPDGRQVNFNHGAQAQAAYTSGIDLGRLRIAAVDNSADVGVGGISMKTVQPVIMDFPPFENTLAYQFRITLSNPAPGRAWGRSLVADAPLDHIQTYSVYETSMSQTSTSILGSLVATDVARITVRWTKCPSGCAPDFDCDGFATGDDFDAFVGAFAEGLIDADFDGNGFVNGDDFDGYVSAFVAGC